MTAFGPHGMMLANSRGAEAISRAVADDPSSTHLRDTRSFAMEANSKATRISLLAFSTPQMRAFHMSWIAFFLCFFAWFGVAPLLSIVRDEMHLSKQQIGWCVIGSVAITIIARLVVGWLCDRFGPRLTYTWLLLLGSLPVMGIGLAHNF